MPRAPAPAPPPASTSVCLLRRTGAAREVYTWSLLSCVVLFCSGCCFSVYTGVQVAVPPVVAHLPLVGARDPRCSSGNTPALASLGTLAIELTCMAELGWR